MEKQLDILKYVIEELRSDKSVTGIMLMGSVAYENASDDSDLDILVLCNEDKFISIERRSSLLDFYNYFHLYVKNNWK